jgi:hypothetical protein
VVSQGEEDSWKIHGIFAEKSQNLPSKARIGFDPKIVSKGDVTTKTIRKIARKITQLTKKYERSKRPQQTRKNS